MSQNIKLQIGDMSENGQVTIVDEDRLCYLVKSISKGAVGLRTISKALLDEFVTYMKLHPETPTNEVRTKISGQSDIDKYEYGYGATLVVMANMILGNTGIIRTSQSTNRKLLFEPCIESKEGINGFLDRAIPIVLERDADLYRLDKFANVDGGVYLTIGRHNLGRASDKDARPNDINPNIEWTCGLNGKRYYLNREVNYPNFVTFQEAFNEAYKGIFEIVIDTIDYNGAERKRYSLYGIAQPTASKISLEGVPHQQIFYGAPGTGKSHTIKVATEACPKENVVRTTFHPDSDYSTFVGAYKPAMQELPRYNPQTGERMGEEKKIVYAYTPQAFLKAYVKAWQVPEEPVFLIIEEINRGNCAQIFGDLFQLLDRGDDGHSCYPIKADQDMQQYLTEALSGCEGLDEKIRSGEELQFPSNLYIWATMNTSDQSLFPIDSAFKRRWEWRYMPIAQGRDEKTGQPLQWRIVAEKSEYDWWSFLQKINEQIASTTSSEDKKLGFFFTKAKEGVISAEKFVSKVIFYLWNDVFKDYGFDNKIFQILNEENATLTFDKFYTIDNTGNTIVRKDLVERFLEELGVEKAGTIDNGQLTMDNEDDEKVSDLDNSTLKFSIIFADGTEVLEKTQFGSYAKALKRIGLEKVEPIATQLKYSRLGCPLVSKEEYEEILDNTQGYSYVNVDGYNIIKGINLRTMRNFLTQVSEELGLGLNLEIK